MSSFFYSLQLEKELYKVLEDQKILLETASEKCEVAEHKLSHIEQQINQAQKEVMLSFSKITEVCCDVVKLKNAKKYV